MRADASLANGDTPLAAPMRERDPKLAFPAASVIHGRKYWNRTDIDAWMRRMAIGKATAKTKSPPAAPAESRQAAGINQLLVGGGIQFATPRDRCLYLGTEKRHQLKWLEDHPGNWRHVRDIPKEADLLVRKDGNGENDVTLVTRAGDCSPPYEPTSPPTPVAATVTNRSAKAEPLRGTKATISEATGPKTDTTPLVAMGRKRSGSGGRQIKKQKLPAEISKPGRKRSLERMRIVLDSLSVRPKKKLSDFSQL